MDRPIVVIKVGTSSLVDTRAGAIQVAQLARLVEAVVYLTSRGFYAVIVSSGAVGLGCARMALKSRPTTIAGKQAAAAVGQVRLMSLYDDLFSVLGMHCAQVLLTYDAFGDRGQYLNARNTFAELLRMGAVPIVNENDTVAVQELRVGDNDTLSALVAAMIGAQWLFLLTDVEALYTADPRVLPSAAPIRVVPTRCIQDLRKQMLAGRIPLEVMGSGGSSLPSGSGSNTSPPGNTDAATTPATPPSAAAGGGAAGSQWGTGGMATKLKAAQLATAAGVTVLVTSTGNVGEVVKVMALGHGPSTPVSAVAASLRSSPTAIQDAAALHLTAPSPTAVNSCSSSTMFLDRDLGTTFLPAPRPVTGRKRWLLSLVPQGSLILDVGAREAVEAQRKSLFPAGIVGVRGTFEAQDAVSLVCVTDETVEVARALVNYSSEDCLRLKGRKSKDTAGVLGYLGAEALADRDNIVLLLQPGEKDE